MIGKRTSEVNSMKIDQFHSNYVQKMYKTTDEKKAGYVEGKTTSKSTVEISTQAKALVKRIRESEDTQISNKVENLRKQIKDGTYKVDADKLADKILKVLDEEQVRSHE